MIEEFVERIVAKQIDEHQFENADITFREIQSVKKIFSSKTNKYLSFTSRVSRVIVWYLKDCKKNKKKL